MRNNSLDTALAIWFRGHLLFFVLSLFIVGPLAILTSFLLLLVTSPVIAVYTLLVFLVKRHLANRLYRMALLILLAVLTTHCTYVLTGGMEDQGMDSILIWMHRAALLSAAASAGSVFRQLRNAQEMLAAAMDGAPPTDPSIFSNHEE